jgi:hypothetical protein
MAAFLLESLVLPGVTILTDGTAVNLRRGTGKAKENPEVFISMRHPLASVQVYPQPAGQLGGADSDPPAWANLGAGRSRRCAAGVLVGSARNPEQAILSGWSSSRGGDSSTIAVGLGLLTTRHAAFVGEEASRHPQARSTRSCGYGIAVFAPAALQCFETARWCKPAGRTPPASTRGK